MAFDGTVIACMVKELKEKAEGGRIAKIAQPEPDELMLTLKKDRDTSRLLISANASLPLIYFTDKNKTSPMTAPNFCMLLRKHIGTARIVSVVQPDFERIIDFTLEHPDDLGDLCRKHLIVELMGKHSNIIFCDEGYKIIDSIKHVSAQVSSVREVLPGRDYFITRTVEKENPLLAAEENFIFFLTNAPQPLYKALYGHFTGISPAAALEICCRASLDSVQPANTLNPLEQTHLFRTFSYYFEDIAEGRFAPAILYQKGEPAEFTVLPSSCYEDCEIRLFPSVSLVLETYYAEKNAVTRSRQKSADLRRIIQTLLERNVKKLELQEKQMKDTEKRDKYRVYGELLNTYGYSLQGGERFLKALNYYTNEEIEIPLDETLSAKGNAQKYFDRYNKLKRTYEALSTLLVETREEIDHLESIAQSLDIAMTEADLAEIKEEMREFGYIKKRGPKEKKGKSKSKPFHYVSSDGFHIYIGKNNYQNEELTFKVAQGNDWWFHAKGIPGSHVIVQTKGQELPDRVFEEAGRLAAYYSKGRGGDKVEIDYIQRKHVKKVSGAKPGFVIYHTNYSMVSAPDIQGIREEE